VADVSDSEDGDNPRGRRDQQGEGDLDGIAEQQGGDDAYQYSDSEEADGESSVATPQLKVKPLKGIMKKR
jgi:hypothetical protein